MYIQLFLFPKIYKWCIYFIFVPKWSIFMVITDWNLYCS